MTVPLSPQDVFKIVITCIRPWYPSPHNLFLGSRDETMCIYMCICVSLRVCTYIYIERERERDVYIYIIHDDNSTFIHTSS